MISDSDPQLYKLSLHQRQELADLWVVSGLADSKRRKLTLRRCGYNRSDIDMEGDAESFTFEVIDRFHDTDNYKVILSLCYLIKSKLSGKPFRRITEIIRLIDTQATYNSSRAQGSEPYLSESNRELDQRLYGNLDAASTGIWDIASRFYTKKLSGITDSDIKDAEIKLNDAWMLVSEMQPDTDQEKKLLENLAQVGYYVNRINAGKNIRTVRFNKKIKSIGRDLREIACTLNPNLNK